MFWSSGVQPPEPTKMSPVALAMKSMSPFSWETTPAAASVSLVMEPSPTVGIGRSAGPTGAEPDWVTLIWRASGFVPKSAPIGEVGAAIRAVLDGQIWVPGGIGSDEAEAAMAERVVNLTPQQMRVFAGMAEGKLNKQIAYEMAIAEQTVKDHVTVILRKLGATNRTQAILVASQLALKPPPPLE